MVDQSARYISGDAFAVAQGWAVERLTTPSRLYGANGMTVGKDGRIYVAQVAGSQVSAINPETGVIEQVSPMDGGITAPDDLVFDDEGNLYCTEITINQISLLKTNGTTEVIGDMPVANPITMHQGRLFAGGCHIGAKIVEIDRDTKQQRTLIDNVPMPNAFAVGPDGKLYFPVMGANEIWRVDLAGGEPEVVAKDLGVPDSVKFDTQGQIISTQVASGQVLRINPQTGEKTVLADIGPGLDNCAIIGDRVYASHITGSVHEIGPDGKVRAIAEKGLQWPMGLALDSEGTLFIADGGFTYTLVNGEKQLLGMLFTPGFPGFTRAVVAGNAVGEWIVCTADGVVARWNPAEGAHEVLASGHKELMGIAKNAAGDLVFAEHGTGKILALAGGQTETLAEGLAGPMGVAVASDGTVYVAESEAGRVVKIAGGRAETVLDGVSLPEGIAVRDTTLFVVDTGAHQVVALDLVSGERTVLASNLPVGAPVGVIRKFVGGVGDMCGPMMHMTSIAAGADGTLYVSGDAEGSVLALRQV